MENQKKTLTFWKMVTYSAGIFGIQMLVGYMNVYQSQFYTSVLQANLMTCAVIILCAKILSSFADPIIGNIIDRSNFKSGKMKPFVAMSIIPFAVITTLMFVAIDFPNNGVKYFYITVTSVLWNMIMSFADIPSQGMLAVISSSSEEKNACAGISNTLKSLALVACNGVVPVICVLTDSAAITKKEYMIAGVAMGVAAMLFVLLMLATTKEVVKSEPQKMSLRGMFAEMKDNKPLLLIFLVNMLGFGRNIAVAIGVQAAAVLFRETTIHLGSQTITLAGENLPLILGVGAAIPSSLSVLLIPLISKKIGYKKAFMIFGVYGVITSVLVYVLFITSPADGFWRSVIGIIIMQFITNFMFGPHGYTPMVMLSDAVDYREMTTGKRTEGTQYSVLCLSIKLANAFSVATGIFMVGASGYTGTMTYNDITPHMQNIVISAYYLIPGICVLLSMIPMFFFKLDRPEIQKQIKDFVAKRDACAAEKAE